MAKGKKPMAAAIQPLDVAPVPLNAGRCPTCRRPQYGQPKSLTERVLGTSRNALVRFMRLHDGIDHTTISDQLARWVGQEPTRSAAESAVLFDVLLDFCNGRRILSTVVVETFLEGRSYRSVGAELGIDDKTVAEIVRGGKHILDQLCAQARIRVLEDPRA